MVPDDIQAEDSDSFGSLADERLSENDDDDGDLQDNWIEELECALLAECDPATLKKICDGRKIPSILRPDYWRTLLALNDAEKVKLTNEFDLPNQDELRRDCERLVEDISMNVSPNPLSDTDKLKLKSDFESTLTTYVKARPELEYVPGNGWTDILRVLYNLNLDDVQIYQMFFRIVDRYIPRDLSLSKRQGSNQQTSNQELNPNNDPKGRNILESKPISAGKQPHLSGSVDYEKSIQAYHLLRLLIQYHDPELCSILDSRKVTPNLYVKDWFCSLFARSCTPQLALHMWDIHFKMADPFLIFFAAIVMVVNASDELKKSNMSQQGMSNVLKVMPSKLEEDDIEDLYYLVSNHYTFSTPRSIRSYSHLFFMDTFGNTYSGNESPDRDASPTFMDAKTTRLTSSIDLSQYLCLPIVPAEIFALETAKKQQQASSSPNSSPTSNTQTHQSLRYFLVDCRPAEQYNAGHLNKAFHLDCSLMLREPSSFATAVQALLEIQRQVVASKSNTGGQHLCFIGSGQEEEDQYVNMVVASFLRKYQKYVSIVFGGFDAIHDYIKTKNELSDSFNKYIVDHNESLCKSCCSGSPEAMERLRLRAEMEAPVAQPIGGLSSSIFATTSNFFKTDKASAQAALSKFASSNPQATATASMLAQSGASMFDKFTTAFVSKSSVLKDRLVETINNSAIPNSAYSSARAHVSSQDKLGPRYMGSGDKTRSSDAIKTRLNEAAASLLTVNTVTDHALIDEEPCQEVQIDIWQRDNNIMAIYNCAQIKGTNKYPGHIALNKTHLWILREIPHNKGFASIAAKRPLDMIVQITSKRRQPDLIIFRYGHAASKTPSGPSSPAGSDQASEGDRDTSSTTESSDGNAKPQSRMPTIIASDNLHIPQAFEVIRLIKHEIVRIMDETSRKYAPTVATASSNQSDRVESQVTGAQEANNETSESNTTEDATTTSKTSNDDDKQDNDATELDEQEKQSLASKASSPNNTKAESIESCDKSMPVAD